MSKKTHRNLLLNSYYYFLAIFALTMITSCKTLTGPNAEEAKQAEIVRTQKSLVISFLNKGLPGLALKELRKHIRMHPNDADFKNLMGLTLLALKTPQKSIKYFKQARKINDKISFSLNLGSAYIESQQYKKAIIQLKRIRKHQDFDEYQHPERVTHNIGLASEKLGRTKDAERHYRRALKENPKFYISLMRLGQLKENKKQYIHARKLFTRAQQVCNICFDPVNGIAMTYISQHKPQKAIQILSRFMKQKSASKRDKERARKMLSIAGKKRKYR